MSKNKKSNIMWGGRFSSNPEKIMERINSSIDFDKRLFEQDIRASIVHARMLSEKGIITKKSSQNIVNGLNKIKIEIEANKFNFRSDLEDIHMNIENRLFELIGEDAGFLHTGRSRNDQVATDFRLWVRDGIDEITLLIKSLMKSLLKKAEDNFDLIMPGFTHLQVAQPITFGHHLLAYIEMLSRDLERYEDTRRRLNFCPLGAAALAGTSFKIDRHFTARELGFEDPMTNSLDAVSDRDFCIDFVAASALCLVHLSRFAEELVVWTSSQYSFVKFSDKFSTGSSIMPQKKNPDAAELVRGKVGRVNGALIALLTTIKGLPLAYSKDLQEDKEPVFDCYDTIKLCLKAMDGMVSDMEPIKEVLKKEASVGFSTATDLADWLTKNLGLTFRESHKVSGAIVKLAEIRNCKLEELSLEVFQSVDNRINSEVYSVLTTEASVASRNSYGGTSPSQVKYQIGAWKKRLM